MRIDHTSVGEGMANSSSASEAGRVGWGKKRFRRMIIVEKSGRGKVGGRGTQACW